MEHDMSPRYRKVYPPGEGVTEEGPPAAAPRGPDAKPAPGQEARMRSEIKQLRRELHDALEQLDAAKNDNKGVAEANERYLRLAAEMENLRKRHRQEQVERLQYANSELITKLLPVLDNFHRALDHANDADPQMVSGLLMIVRQLEDILESEGVVPIKAEGERFDPALHQAVMAEPSPDHEDGTVIQELQRGYMMRDRVLRPSLVKIAQNS
jgi:molecular chaperone GrpE